MAQGKNGTGKNGTLFSLGKNGTQAYTPISETG